MPTPDLLTPIAQSSAAGLIALMWLTERRSAAARDRQVTDLADRLTQERATTATLLSVIGDNTRALAAIEIGQRSLATILDRITAAIVGTRGPSPSEKSAKP